MTVTARQNQQGLRAALPDRLQIDYIVWFV